MSYGDPPMCDCGMYPISVIHTCFKAYSPSLEELASAGPSPNPSTHARVLAREVIALREVVQINAQRVSEIRNESDTDLRRLARTVEAIADEVDRFDLRPLTRAQLQMTIWGALHTYGYPITTNAALAAADAVLDLRELRDAL